MDIYDGADGRRWIVEPLLLVRRVLREQFSILHRRLLAIVRDDEVCRRLMTTPGVGPVVALTYRATVDVPARFRNSKAVGAVFGADAFQVSVGRDQPNRRDIKVRGRDDAGDALRSSPDHAGAYGEVVLAQGLGNPLFSAFFSQNGEFKSKGFRFPCVLFVGFRAMWRPATARAMWRPATVRGRLWALA